MPRCQLFTIVLAAAGLSIAFDHPSSASQRPADPGRQIPTSRNLASAQLVFTENRGQWDERALFRADAAGATMWLAADGVVYQFIRPAPAPDGGGPDATPNLRAVQTEDARAMGEQLAVKSSLVGANPQARVIGRNETGYRYNYFVGADPNGWHVDVPNYLCVVYENVYDGIDVLYYGNGHGMEYDFLVAPGADVSQIRIRYEGIESLEVNGDGELVVATGWGVMKELAPVAYQDNGGRRVPISSAYRKASEHSFGFRLAGDVDPRLPLVIDPGLYFGTYLGGTGDEFAYAVAVDDEGYVYVTGYTASPDFPTQLTQHYWKGNNDVFVTKLGRFGSGLAYSTYLGGAGGERGYAIAVDDSGNTYVTGSTGSSTFPTRNAYQDDPPACDSHAFLTKLNPCGNWLVYSTFLSGNSADWGNAIAVDGGQHAYVAGVTQSTDFPTKNAYQTDQNVQDAFVTKFSSAGDSLVYSTYLGGDAFDKVWGLAVDEGGTAYLTGETASTDFPTQNAFQTDQGTWDAFVTRLAAEGDSLLYSTYLGGSSGDWGRSIAVDAAGNAYVTGNTMSFNFPTQGPYQTFQGNDDVFVTKLDPTGGSLVYSTYVGGIAWDLGFGIALDGVGNAYVAGWTRSANFPIVDPYQTDQDTVDAFVFELNAAGDDLVYSTYLGGDGADEAWGIAVDGDGDAYVTGYTMSTDFPTQTPYQTYQGGMDAFVAKLSDTPSTTGEAEDPAAPDGIELHQNRPNPFNPSTVIAFVLPERARATLAIYASNGALVRTLVDGMIGPGRTELTWDGADSDRRPVASGVYFCRLRTGETTLTRKLVLIK